MRHRHRDPTSTEPVNWQLKLLLLSSVRSSDSFFQFAGVLETYSLVIRNKKPGCCD